MVTGGRGKHFFSGITTGQLLWNLINNSSLYFSKKLGLSSLVHPKIGEIEEGLVGKRWEIRRSGRG